jgi:hypothetical protein
MASKKPKKKIKGRNWVAVAAHFRKGGAMKDRKKEANRKACRKNWKKITN